MMIWRVNMQKKTLNKEDVPDHWEKLGGRGLSAQILVDEVPAVCEPLGPRNKLIFAPGLLVGHMLSSCDRISIGGKSPLTGGIKEANAGGSTGLTMACLGIKALILEGFPLDNDWQILYLDKDGARFENAGDIAGLGVYDSAKKLIQRYGDKIGIALIGPGGERELFSAGIQNLDKDKEPSRIAARGGLGAVMGSKKIKAIIFDAAGTNKPLLKNPEAFRQAQKIYTQALMNQPQTKVYADYGTAAMPRMSNGFGGMPTRNFSSGQFEDVEKISGEYMRNLLIERGGESNPTHACMAGCTIRCSNIFGDANGKKIVAPLEYETIALVGSNLGISNLDTIARLNWEINDLGLDSIEIGAALGVATEAGLMRFGDGDAAQKLVEEIRKNTPLGRIIGSGAGITGKVLGVKRVPIVKNQAMSGYEPRAIKGTGVTYATTPQGADHTCGLTIRAKVDHLDPNVQVAISRASQINMAGYDSLGACIFAGFGFGASPQSVKDLINARYGWDVNEDYLQVLGKRTLSLEREFNRRAGFTAKDDRLPEWMTTEPVPPHNAVFDVKDEDLDSLFNWE